MSGFFPSFARATCSLSVTREYLGLGGGPPRFTRNFTGSVLLGIPLGRYGRFRLRDSYPLWCAFPCASTNAVLCHSLGDRQIPLNGPTTPNTQRLPAITRTRFSLFRFRSPLLTESRLLSLPAGNEMFHFPAFPPLALCVQARVTGHDSCRVSPFGNPRITARLTAPRGLSQPPTSFIGSWCQAIHRAPLLTWPQRCSRPLCSSQGTGGPGLHPSPTSGWRWFDVDRSFRDGAPDPRRIEGSCHRGCPLITDRSRELVQIPQDPTARLGRSPARLPVPEPKLCTREKRDVVAAYWSVFHP